MDIEYECDTPRSVAVKAATRRLRKFHISAYPIFNGPDAPWFPTECDMFAIQSEVEPPDCAVFLLTDAAMISGVMAEFREECVTEGFDFPDPPSLLVVAEEGHPVGFIGFDRCLTGYITDDEVRLYYTITADSFFVRDASRMRGVGTCLVAALCDLTTTDLYELGDQLGRATKPPRAEAWVSGTAVSRGGMFLFEKLEDAIRAGIETHGFAIELTSDWTD